MKYLLLLFYVQMKWENDRNDLIMQHETNISQINDMHTRAISIEKQAQEVARHEFEEKIESQKNELEESKARWAKVNISIMDCLTWQCKYIRLIFTTETFDVECGITLEQRETEKRP